MSVARLGLFDDALRVRYGAGHLIGVDEAGRGPLAGPVVAAAVLLRRPVSAALEGVDDSKQLSPRRREALYPRIRSCALEVGVGWASPREIDSVNILQATFLAMRRALDRLDLSRPGTFVVVDGNRRVPRMDIPQEALVEADAHSLSVACASVIAKVVRDRWMGVLDRRFPGYGFGRNKGYGTAAHLEALRLLGRSPEHRRSFHPAALQGALL